MLYTALTQLTFCTKSPSELLTNLLGDCLFCLTKLSYLRSIWHKWMENYFYFQLLDINWTFEENKTKHNTGSSSQISLEVTNSFLLPYLARLVYSSIKKTETFCRAFIQPDKFRDTKNNTSALLVLLRGASDKTFFEKSCHSSAQTDQ